MIGYRTAAAALVLLAACEADPINATSDSQANQLAVGMSPAQVSAVIGRPQFQTQSESNANLTCLSYVYDEAIDARFVHVTFDNDQLMTASDRHRQVCELP